MNENTPIDNMKNALGIMSMAFKQLEHDIDLSGASIILKELAQLLQNIPDDVKETVFFDKVQSLKEKDLQYEDILWLNEEYGNEYINDNKKWLIEEKTSSELLEYIKGIINSETLPRREKLVVLLSHFEPLIYYILNVPKSSNIGIKQAVKTISVDNNIGMSVQCFGKLFILAVTYIVFSRTDSFQNPIDKRIPFRNNILHNGIVSYNDQEVEKAYELLVDYICMLVHLGGLLCDS